MTTLEDTGLPSAAETAPPGEPGAPSGDWRRHHVAGP